ncbi:hypothetical protein Pst134EB_013996 [Puccinia striiformis f. sp. tritici]|nr:hypothetical protein Pst134EB_013996 [Puccinia striiformis f. sp. tritici]
MYAPICPIGAPSRYYSQPGRKPKKTVPAVVPTSTPPSSRPIDRPERVFALNAFPQGFENLQELIPSTPEYPPGTLSSPSKSQRRKGMVFSP